MLGMPGTTEFDLRFRLLGIPVRIHPLFWAIAALLGWGGQSGLHIVVWIVCCAWCRSWFTSSVTA